MSATNNWTAVCALDESVVNTILVQQFLNNGPGSPQAPLVFGADLGNVASTPLQIVLGSPLLTFATDGTQSATVSMSVISAMGISVPGLGEPVVQPDLVQAQWVPVSGLSMQRSAQLQTLQGSVDYVGQAVLTFGGGGSSGTPWSILQAVEDYLATNPIQYVLGTLLMSMDPLVNPVGFSLVIQPSPDGQSAALLMLMSTGIPSPPAGPLPSYPLPSGCTAALIVDGGQFQGIIAGCIVEALMNGDGEAGISPYLSGMANADGIYTFTAIQDGAANLLYFATLAQPDSPVGPIAIPLAGNGNSFVVSPNPDGTFATQWSSQIPQYGSFTYSGLSTPSLGPGPAEITYTSNGTFSFEATGLDSLCFWGLPPNMGPIENPSTYQNYFPLFTNLNFSLFTFVNLMFPQGNAVTLNTMAFDSAVDLFLTGTLETPMTITPAVATVPPNGTVPFTASQPVTWEASVGRFNKEGVYTAPETDVALAVTITAVNDSTSTTAYALVNVVPKTIASSIVISPQNVLGNGTFGVELVALDQNGDPVAVTWTASTGYVVTPEPDNVGKAWFGPLPQGDPSVPWPVPAGTTVTLTATLQSDPTQTASATYTAGTIDPIAISGSQPAPGQTAPFTASAQSGATAFSWIVWPPDCGGSVDANEVNAVVTAPPASFTGTWYVVVFYADPTQQMLGAAAWSSS